MRPSQRRAPFALRRRERAIVRQSRLGRDPPLPPGSPIGAVPAHTPGVTSRGWPLYVNDFHIPKYWTYKEGAFFKVFDPLFFQDHRGLSLRFSENGVDFVDTGFRLAPPSALEG